MGVEDVIINIDNKKKNITNLKIMHIIIVSNQIIFLKSLLFI